MFRLAAQLFIWVQTLAQLANLRPWKKGQSGNSVGAARGYRHVLKRRARPSPEAMQKAIECMRDDAAPWLARLKAIEIILDRAWGAPDRRMLLDEESVTSITIDIVGPDGTEREWNQSAATSADAATANPLNSRELENALGTSWVARRSAPKQ